MKKKIVLILFLLLFSIAPKVKAETYDTWSCVYGDSIIKFAIFLDKEMMVTNTYQGVATASYNFDDIYKKQVPASDPKKDNGKCPEKMYINNPGVSSGIVAKETGDISFNPNGECGISNSTCHEIILYQGQIDDEFAKTLSSLASQTQTTISIKDGVEKETPKQVTAEDAKNNSPKGKITCVSKYQNILDKYIESLLKSDKNTLKYEEEIKKYCNNVLKTYNYSNEPECLNKCTNLSTTVATEKKKYEQTVDKDGCYLSAGGRNFLKNIIKWVKLILPVLLIVLSIFDFLRAIANEDEGMKRAKKHLINRLIAIALIYTLPSFIEFFLERFGFIYEECSILLIKLLK